MWGKEAFSPKALLEPVSSFKSALYALFTKNLAGGYEKQMEFPELVFGNEEVYLDAQREIADFFCHHQGPLYDIVEAATGIRQIYISLQHFFDAFTGPICRMCPEPCCVNRHGFPDFEDLVVFQAMGTRAPVFDCSSNDTGPCQFLSPAGCVLPRYRRSYRCTWYFCDFCMDRFEQKDAEEFRKFESTMSQLARDRNRLLKQFERQWFADGPHMLVRGEEKY